MAAIAHLRREEKLGLGIAVVLHAALVAALLVGSWRSPPKIPPAERMTVSLSDNVALTSTAPNPSDAAQAAVAPVLAPESAPLPAPTSVPVPSPVQPTVDRTPPKPVPAARAPAPKPTAVPKQAAKPAAQQAPKAPAKPAQAAPSKSGGGSRLGADFLRGLSSGERANSGTPAATFGPAESASLQQAINRQLKPHWSAPQGVDAELLVTVLAWDLNPDGSLAGTPRVVSQSGITDSNRPQAKIHAERAIRAVQLAAPFDLPPQFYDKWKRIRAWRFDRKL